MRGVFRSHTDATLAAILLAALLVVFLIVEAAQVPLLIAPESFLRLAGPAGAAISGGLLVADVVLPVPASVVMLPNGALFGFTAGAAISFVGGLGATLMAFAIGSRSRGLLSNRVESDCKRSDDGWFDRYGAVAIVVSRPVPMLAETVAIMAGRSGLPWRTAMPAAAAGAIVPAVIYAAAGAAAATVSPVAVLVGLLAVVVLVWGLGRWVGSSLLPRTRPKPTDVD